LFIKHLLFARHYFRYQGKKQKKNLCLYKFAATKTNKQADKTQTVSGGSGVTQKCQSGSVIAYLNRKIPVIRYYLSRNPKKMKEADVNYQRGKYS
jgi:hypothetical protein